MNRIEIPAIVREETEILLDFLESPAFVMFAPVAPVYVGRHRAAE